MDPYPRQKGGRIKCPAIPPTPARLRGIPVFLIVELLELLLEELFDPVILITNVYNVYVCSFLLII